MSMSGARFLRSRALARPMSLRAHHGPAASKSSAKVGEVVVFEAKVENKGTGEDSVMLLVEGLKEGALGKPVEFAFSFDPPAVGVRPKARERVAFSWTAALPPGRSAFTFRGKLVLRRVLDGSLVEERPLDLYVSS